MRRLLVLSPLLWLLPSCQFMAPYEDYDGSLPDGPGAREASVDSSRVDQTRTDGPVADATLPDLGLPDTWPPFDLGGTVCSTLWPSPVVMQVSTANDSLSGSAPALVALGDTFFVAYEEGGQIRLWQATPAAPAAGTFTVTLTTASQPEHAPAMVYDAQSGRLALAWHRDIAIQNSPALCDRDLIFQEVTPGQPGLTAGPQCNLTPQAGNTHGYGPVSLASSGGQYLIASPLHYNNTACGAHVKAQVGVFSTQAMAACPSFPGGYNSSIGVEVWHPLITTLGAGTSPLRLLRGIRQGSSSTPENMTIAMLGGNATGGGWSAIAGLPPAQDALVRTLRPGLVFDGTDLWSAWTDNNWRIRVMLNDQASALINAANSTDPVLGQEPSLAAHPVHGAVIVFARSQSAGGFPDEVRLVRLGKPSIAQGQGVTVKSATALTDGSGSSGPRAAVVAAGRNGFGVAWQETISVGRTEVFFRWVGCQ